MPWFDCAIRRPINANTGGIIGTNLGLILHHAVMNGSGWNLFNNPATQASAHFWVFKNGTIEQYVDSSVVSWHGKSLNTNYCGVETEGCPTSPYAEPMTEEMVNALARLYKEGNARHGWANALINQQGQRGFGYHRMAVQTACPCDVRLNRRQDILNRAFGGAVPGPPTPQEEADNMVLFDPVTRGYWVAFRDGAVHTQGPAPYLGGCNNDKYNAGKFPCIGIAPRPDDDGYVLVLDFGNNPPARARFYDFPRNGSGIV